MSEATIEKSSPAIANTVLGMRGRDTKISEYLWMVIPPISRGEFFTAHTGTIPTRFKQEQDSDEDERSEGKDPWL